MKYSKIFIMFSALVISFQQITVAQTKIQNSVLGNGGIKISGSSNRIMGTVGQPAIGKTSNSNNYNYIGFWYQAGILNITDVEQLSHNPLPKEYMLKQNYPNPFNPTTTILFSIPKQSMVTLRICDVLGKEITVLLDEELQPGEYKAVFDAGQLPSGIYFYHIKAEEFRQVKKLMLLK